MHKWRTVRLVGVICHFCNDWGDGRTRVNVTFLTKGEVKSTVAVGHERLADADETQRMKAYWRDRVAALKEVLERGL